MSPSHPDELSPGYRTLLATSAVFTSLSAITVILRFAQRAKAKGFWWDDWTILFSFLFALGMLTAVVLGGTRGGAGYHSNTYSDAQLETFRKILLAGQVLYNWSIMTSKVSALFYYYRVFAAGTVMQRPMQCLGAALVANCVAISSGLIFSHNPVRGQWDSATESMTIDKKALWIAAGAINIVFDLAVLGIPQRRLWRQHMPEAQRLAVCLFMLVGASACVATMVRLAYMSHADPEDMTYDSVVPGSWAAVEANVSILCACLPVVYKLFTGRKRERLSESPIDQDDSIPGVNKVYLELEWGVHPTLPGSYRVKVQSPSVASQDELAPLGPIRVERSFKVSVD